VAEREKIVAENTRSKQKKEAERRVEKKKEEQRAKERKLVAMVQKRRVNKQLEQELGATLDAGLPDPRKKQDKIDANCHTDGRKKLQWLVDRREAGRDYWKKFDIHSEACESCNIVPQHRGSFLDAKVGAGKCLGCIRHKLLLHAAKKYIPIEKFVANWTTEHEVIYLKEYLEYFGGVREVQGEASGKARAMLREWRDRQVRMLELSGDAEEFLFEIRLYDQEYADWETKTKKKINEIIEDVDSDDLDEIQDDVLDEIDEPF
jgi:hypothetical protein